MRGSVTFEDYDSKLMMMDDAPYKLDMKLFDQQGNIKFVDADFANLI